MSAQRRWSGPVLGKMAVIGVGQIGGSVALGARVAGAVTEVVAWSRTREKLDRAQALGIIDRGARSTAEAARGAGVVVLATPVRSLGEAAAAVARELAEGAVVFDVGSVKAAAIASVEPKLRPGAFVPCHPIAGTERVGPDAASPLLFEGKRCVICPTPRSNEQNVATVERLWTALGAEPVRMTAQLHDRVFGAGSHLPHVAAYALAAALGQLAPDVIDGIRRLPTSSLRDTTRVAASSPAMWRDIFLDNRSEILPLIEALASCVQELRAAVAAGDADRIEKVLLAGKAGRDRVIGG
jgi:prephenate dehydrogenase